MEGEGKGVRGRGRGRGRGRVRGDDKKLRVIKTHYLPVSLTATFEVIERNK